mmetsp:Transcript_12355/g.18737  ORF Transcript_12355/g.18737 Transcript_12355/m.18737 type:complete len:333 (-) Transcript_12355:88-1086(-)
MKSKPALPNISTPQFYFYADEATKKSLVFTIAATVVTALCLRYAEYRYDGENIWKDWKGDIELTAEQPVYSELRHYNNVFRTEVNSWSNICYIVVGYHAIATAYQDYIALSSYSKKYYLTGTSNYLLSNPQFSLLFGMGCIHLGIGSGLFHASLTVVGRQLDVASMYSPLMALISLMICRWYPYMNHREATGGGQSSSSTPCWPLHFVVVILCAILFFVYKWELDALLGFPASSIILPVLIILGYALALVDRAYYPHRQAEWRFMGLSFACVLVGFLCRILDVLRMFSSSTSPLQGHSFWHLLTAMALCYMYTFQRTVTTPTSASLTPVDYV